MCVYTYVYLYMCKCVYLWFVCVYVCVYMWMYVWMFAYMYIYIYIYVYVCIYVYVYIYIYIYIYINTCMYVYIDIYIYTRKMFFIRFAVHYLLTFHSSYYNSICWCWKASTNFYFELTQEDFLSFSQNTSVYIFPAVLETLSECSVFIYFN